MTPTNSTAVIEQCECGVIHVAGGDCPRCDPSTTQDLPYDITD